MAKIVGVHGIGQQFGGGYQLGTVWFAAVRDGLVRADHRAAAETLLPTDLTVAFFGDLFRPPGAMAAQGPPYSAADIQPGPERDLLVAFFEAALACGQVAGAPEGSMNARRVTAQFMLERLVRTPTLAQIAQRTFVGNLKQVTAFLEDPSVKEHVLTCLHAEIEKDTQVLIGHSLGSVVAYEYLCRYQPATVKLFLTLGSPLGIPNIIFDQLTPPPVAGMGMWPGRAAWVNVADRDDIVALRKNLAPLFPGPAGQEISDRRVNNGNLPHAIDRYLNTRQTGSALGDVIV